jgi:hypothetical protein
MEKHELQEFIEIINELVMIDIDPDTDDGTFYGTYDGEYFKVSESDLKIEQVSKQEVINFYKQKERKNELVTWEKEACLSCHLMD